ncbi:MAG: periplasmic heavy metal sensor [Alphaproteobacteria bacterium]|nr:periplasmic heavy metal sensor [Alphaproteobacteria bacterium]
MNEPRFKSWLVLLAVSLALNLFLGVRVATTTLHQAESPPRAEQPPRMPPPMLERMASRLPKGDAALLRAAVAEQRGALDEARRQTQQAIEILHRVIAAETLDPAALNAAADAVQAKRHEERFLVHKIIMDVMPRLTLEGRRSLLPPSSEMAQRNEGGAAVKTTNPGQSLP